MQPGKDESADDLRFPQVVIAFKLNGTSPASINDDQIPKISAPSANPVVSSGKLSLACHYPCPIRKHPWLMRQHRTPNRVQTIAMP